ncbi:MAG TPA: tetratricopeptide repeat protein [Longimicrobiales bacterium]|nr:tetratricopeptide repeat protein [Longimicrobiales bacterium]
MWLTRELHRRRMGRVVMLYAAATFVALQVADLLVHGLGLPAGLFSDVVWTAALGFPPTLVLGWLFVITPAGLRRHGNPIEPTPSDEPAHRGDLLPTRVEPHPRSVAALPFSNLTGDPDQDFFSDGITEEILARVAAISDLRVVSRTSVTRYKVTNKPLRTIASELGVANILEGSVRRFGTRVRITAKLIEARTDTHLWGETYDRELADVFAVQTEVATHIAEALHANITDTERRQLARHATRDMEAYDLYLRGRQQLDLARPSGITSAITLFQQAIERDQDFALAYAALGDAYLNLPYWGRVQPRAIYAAAGFAVQRALRLDPELSEAHTVDATLRIQRDWDWIGAEAAIARALALTPNSPGPFAWACILAGLRGRLDEALAHVEEGLARDPYSPWLLANKGVWLNYAGRHRESRAVLRALIEREPDYGLGHFYYALTLRTLGEFEDALAAYRRAYELLDHHEVPAGSMTFTLTEQGRFDEAAAILQDLLERREREWIDPFAIAAAAIGLGQIEFALDELEKAEAERSFFLLWIRPSLGLPHLAPLRDHPRMKALLRRMWPDDFLVARAFGSARTRSA